MESRLNNLSLRFQKKGFMPIEISGLIKDVSTVLDTSRHFTITDINQELEDLGWGLEILDKATYELLIPNSLTQ